MHNKFFILCFVLFIILNKDSTAQKVVSPGYIVNNSNDTIYGSIVDKDWNVSPHNIKFFKNDESDFKRFTPTDIKAFGIKDKDSYISSLVIVDVSNTRTDELSYSPIPDTMTQQLFLHVLVQGKISLYFNHDEKAKDHFFIRKDNSAVTELILKKYLSEKDPNKIQLVEKFRNQLSLYMNDCSTLSEAIRSVGFNENELKALVSKYNNCIEPVKESYTFKSKSVHSAFGILAGIYSSSLSFNGSINPYFIVSADFKSFTGFSFGCNMIVPLMKRFNRHQLATELMYKKIQFNSSFDTTTTNYIGYNVIYHYNYYLTYYYIKLNLLYRLTVSQKENTDFFLDAGISNSMVIRSQHSFDEKKTYLNETSNSTGDLFGEPHKFHVSLMGGVGITIRHSYSAKIYYERENSLSPYSNLGSTINTFYLLFNYIF